ncbi:MAG: hypothetical protein QGG42_06300 [Phycisphaerae bacterium]|jgi:hypothetical protein|nr:hypothetical protein [Phycisphaerae bacterium]
MKYFVTVMLLVTIIPAAATAARKKKASPYFVYDQADQTINATMLDGAELYDPDLAATSDGLWVTWLKFVPGKGDEIHVALRSKTAPIADKIVSGKPGRYADPTLTVDAAGKLQLTYEAFDQADQEWNIFMRSHVGGGKFGPPQRISPGKSNDINHCVSSDPDGGLWVAWQADRDGKFDILARRVGGKKPGEVEEVASTVWSQWRPSIAVGSDGAITVAWDAYDGQSYNVMIRRRVGDKWKPAVAAAAGPAFQGRPQLAAGRDGRTWILWESGCDNWGKPHRGMPHKNPKLSDSYGPMHRFRLLHIGVIDSNGSVRRLEKPLPMPSFALAAKRENSRPDCRRIGVFYERGLLDIDACGRVWVVYRHYYSPQMSLARGMRTHVESGWRLHARCIDGDAWSKLYEFDIPQRDGLQRLSIAATSNGLAAIWTTGRTDRRKDPLPRGVALGFMSHPKGKPSTPGFTAIAPSPVTLRPRTAAPKPAVVGGKTYKLFYGDLHRHTDLSLCFPFLDGSLEDAYRYAIDVAHMDFLGVTDHTRDINHGNVKSQLWWRCTKAVTRHRLGKRFFPMFTYERSMGETDHNVITLRDDILRDFTYPLTDFWKELDRDSFTVPHAPVMAKTWAHHQDDALRPLIEIYQGCRDHDSQKQVRIPLDKGYHLGFIASSDHVSTSASFACVWAPETKLESIFRSMQARRTFGATDKIRLIFRSGDLWMGQRFVAKDIPEFQIEIDGTAPLKQLTLYDNGLPVSSIPLKEGKSSISTTYKPGKYFTGKHYLYIHLIQTDGNQAWSSPIWVTYDNPVKDPNPKPTPKLSPITKAAAQAPGKLGTLTNLALGKPVTTSFPDGITAGKISMVTDGKLGKFLGHGTKGSAWVQVDLGEVMKLGNIRVWHYYRDGRSYLENRLSISTTGKFVGEETVIFDSVKDGAYSETAAGKLFTFKSADARYIRNSLNKNTANPSTQWMEIEAYGPAPTKTK